MQDVFDLYGQMEVYKVRPTVDTYNTLLRACMRHGELKQAMTIFKRLRTSRRGPDVITYTTLINGFSDAGRPAAAVSLQIYTFCLVAPRSGISHFPDSTSARGCKSACSSAVFCEQVQAVIIM